MPLDARARADILNANERMAGQALRVLGVAVGETGGDPHDERDLRLARACRPRQSDPPERRAGAASSCTAPAFAR